MNESVFTGQTKCKAETKKSHVKKYIVGDKILLGFVIEIIWQWGDSMLGALLVNLPDFHVFFMSSINFPWVYW